MHTEIIVRCSYIKTSDAKKHVLNVVYRDLFGISVALSWPPDKVFCSAWITLTTTSQNWHPGKGNMFTAWRLIGCRRLVLRMCYVYTNPCFYELICLLVIATIYTNQLCTRYCMVKTFFFLKFLIGWGIILLCKANCWMSNCIWCQYYIPTARLFTYLDMAFVVYKVLHCSLIVTWIY